MVWWLYCFCYCLGLIFWLVVVLLDNCVIYGVGLIVWDVRWCNFFDFGGECGVFLCVVFIFYFILIIVCLCWSIIICIVFFWYVSMMFCFINSWDWWIGLEFLMILFVEMDGCFVRIVFMNVLFELRLDEVLVYVFLCVIVDC